ncbi:MAG TPA: DUF429 domain-containing protein, partial [Acidimicrobiales bacterium]|nr:DUF429 domain-containing protein [Acidimicrobiales bacterium]
MAGATPWGARWVVASAKITGSVFAPEPPKVYDLFQEILSEHPSYATIVVNSPVGYANSPATGLRTCDVEAKKVLGRRGMTVRRIPSRPTLIDGHDASSEKLDAVTAMRLPAMKEVAAEMS